ncbi:unnamed protein product [Penicillium manginii]
MGLNLVDEAKAASCDHIPIIDLSNIDSPDVEKRQELARAVCDACTGVGFFYIKNHGIPESLISGIHDAAERFFGLPSEEKMKIYIGNSKKYRGYSPVGAERTTGTDDDPIPEEEAAGVLSEAFVIGYENALDFRKSENDQLPPDTYELYGDNQWPDDETIPGFSATYIEYCARVLELCRRMIRIFALALDVPEDYFDSKINNPGVISRMMHYPAQPVGDQREGLGAHTDAVPGLQVLNHNGEWILTPPIPGTLVVNIADCLSTWTNKKFKSTIHRVTNLSGEERYSIPFFFGVDYDATVSVLENHTSQENLPCREPFKAGDWVREKLSKAYLPYEG